MGHYNGEFICCFFFSISRPLACTVLFTSSFFLFFALHLDYLHPHYKGLNMKRMICNELSPYMQSDQKRIILGLTCGCPGVKVTKRKNKNS
jgi:hypothetical protein